MGQSTDAILFYGCLVGDEGEAPWCTDENGDYSDEDPCEAAEALLSEAGISGIDVGIHCSYSAPYYYIYATEHTAYRGRAKQIVDLKAPRSQLKKACEVLGVEYDPGWYLVSLWSV
jgi:hypothetical protein